VIVVAHLQIAVGTILDVLCITIQTEAENSVYTIGGKLATINEVTTAFAQDDIALANVLKALDDTPVRIQGITGYFI
jgi:hypothetical protein